MYQGAFHKKVRRTTAADEHKKDKAAYGKYLSYEDFFYCISGFVYVAVVS
jgi:hypothetical protein